jgi:putative SOS response-associated peptidase YedK
MCGRFALDADIEAMQRAFRLADVPDKITPRYNIAPTQPIAVITNQDPDRLTFFQWGLVPPWAKDPAIASRLINARSETAHEKPSFRSAFKRRRCLIPATGFYEWPKSPGLKRRPVFIHRRDHGLLAFAGLWETWHGGDGDVLHSATILTGEPNPLVAPLHDRMPVIVAREAYEAWLSPADMGAHEAAAILQPYPAEEMAFYEVSTLVNRPGNDTPEVMAPLSS